MMILTSANAHLIEEIQSRIAEYKALKGHRKALDAWDRMWADARIAQLYIQIIDLTADYLGEGVMHLQADGESLDRLAEYLYKVHPSSLCGSSVREYRPGE